MSAVSRIACYTQETPPKSSLLGFGVGVGYELVCSTEYWPRIFVEPTMIIPLNNHTQKLLFYRERDYWVVAQDYSSWQKQQRGIS